MHFSSENTYSVELHIIKQDSLIGGRFTYANDIQLLLSC